MRSLVLESPPGYAPTVGSEWTLETFQEKPGGEGRGGRGTGVERGRKRPQVGIQEGQEKAYVRSEGTGDRRVGSHQWAPQVARE